MLCSVCKEKPATVHLTQIDKDNKMQKVDLCEECAKEKGLNEPAGFMLADALLGLGAAQEIEQAATGGEVVCPSCGFTQSDFKKSGRFGCADCYAVFSEGLDGLLKTMHKGTRHIGKTPRQQRDAEPATEGPDRLKQLNKRLEDAIAQEDYEQAAMLRDEIRTCKSQASKKA
jgi:protein arginine kinase activator